MDVDVDTDKFEGTEIGPDGKRYPVGEAPDAVAAPDYTEVYGTPGTGKVPVWNDTLRRWEFGDAGGSGGAVGSVNGRVGNVVLTYVDVGADQVGAADAALAALGVHAGAADPHTGYQLESQKDQPNGYAGVQSDGHILSSLLPAIAITNVYVVGSEATMLALPAHSGDVAIRTDLAAVNQQANFILATNSPGTLADWKVLPVPADAVGSVNGRTGAVSGLAEQADLATEASSRVAGDNALDARLDTLEAVDPLTQAEGDLRYWPLATDLATQVELDAEAATRTAQDALKAGLEDRRFIESPLTSPWRQWRKALALRAFGTADVMLVGDSITEGYYTAADASAWPQLLRAFLQRANGSTTPQGGEGFVPARHTVTSPAMEARWTHSAGVDQSANPLYGLGLRSVVVHPGDTSTIVFTGTRLLVAYTQKSGGGTINVAIDGGAAQSVATANATTKSGRLLQSAVVADGAHTAVVTATTADVILDGACVIRADETTGVRVWQGGHAGYAAAHFADPTKLWSDILSSVQFDLVVVFLGVNDFNTGQTAAQLQANLETIGNRIKTDSGAVAPSLLYVVSWPTSGTTDAAWLPYTNAVRAAARTVGAAVFDMWEVLGTPDGSAVWYDASHPGFAGQVGVSESSARLLLGVESLQPPPHAARHRPGGGDPLNQTIRKVLDDTGIQNSTTLVAAPELDGVGVLAANAVYALEAEIYYDGPAAADIKFKLALPAGAVAAATVISFPTTATGVVNAANIVSSSLAVALTAGTVGAGTGVCCKVSATITMGGTAGTLGVQYAQATADNTGPSRFLQRTKIVLTQIG